MIALDQHPSGRHFLQIPGPSPVPDRILRAMSLPTIDHRGPEFAHLGKKVIAGLQQIFQTQHPVVIYPASGTGAWEAALANTMSPGDARADVRDRPLRQPVAEDGAAPGPAARIPVRARHRCRDRPAACGWRRGVDAGLIEQRLRADARPPHQGGLRGAQRDLYRRHQRHRRGAPRHRRRRAPGAADGRHHLGPGQRRLPPRRLGCGRHRQRLAEGPDAAAGHQLQRAQPEGAGRQQDRHAAAQLLGLGRDRRDERRAATGPTRPTPTCCTA